MADGARLEGVCTGNRTVGSNPTLSASRSRRVRDADPPRSAGARLAHGEARRKKVAVVALMRRLAIVMWHKGLAAQQQAGCFATAGTEHPESGGTEGGKLTDDAA